jgi:OST-HTH/LOTUS domain/NYN domain
MDLLYSENVDVFCIVSSDSDFTRLAMRLRESGKGVYGIGARKTPAAFQNACDRFTYLEVLDGEPEEPAAAVTRKTAARAAAAPVTRKEAQTPAKKATKAAAATKAATAAKAAKATKTTKATKAQLERLASLLLPAIEANAKDDGWASLGSVGQYVVNTNPTFDSRNYGYSKLSDLVRDVPRLEVREVPSGNGLVVLHVRRAPTGRSRR